MTPSATPDTVGPERVAHRLAEDYAQRHPGELARTLEEVPVEDAVAFLAERPSEVAARSLAFAVPDLGEEALRRLPEAAARRLVAALEPAAAAPLLARLDEDLRERLLAGLPEDRSRELRALVAYPEDTAGHLMDPRVAAFRSEDAVERALRRVRRAADRRIAAVYLVDEAGRLEGEVGLQELALASPEDPLGPLGRPVPGVPVTAGREEILEAFEKRRAPSLPVVDFEGRLVGVLRMAALVEAAQEEASADLQTMVGASRDERALSPPLFAVRKRLPWLEVNLATAFLAASVVGLFEETIARFTALAVLLPVVAGQSGNTGAQALAVTMRGLALREVRARHWLRVARKELLAATLNGVAVAATTALGVFLWSGSTGLTLVIGVSMVISMALAGLSGACIPMLLTSLGQDPAQSSSIILTTVTDVVGFFSFLGIATLLAFML